MKKARILHFEDDPKWRTLVSDRLSKTDHTIVSVAQDLQDSIAMLNMVGDEETDADVVILGGNLSKLRHVFDSARTSSAPRLILDEIERLGLQVRTVGLSGLAMSEFGVQVDIDVTKPEMHDGLPKALDNLQDF